MIRQKGTNKNWQEENHRCRGQSKLTFIIDNVVKAVNGGKSQREQAEIADCITFGIRHNTSPRSRAVAANSFAAVVFIC